MKSIWTENSKLPSFGSFSDEKIKKIDVLIIGGGLAGILCAYKLQEAGVNYLLVEADTIAGQTTCDTTAKITSQHRLIYGRIMETYGLEKARLYYESNQNAVSQYQTLVQDMDCEYETLDSYVYSKADPHRLLLELEAMEKMGHPARLVHELPIPVETVGAVKFTNQAQFHPLKFISAIAEKLNILEHTKVMELEPYMAITSRGRIHARQIIVTTHFPMLNKHGAYFMKLYQSRSYVLGLKGSHRTAEQLQVHGMYVDEAENGLSFRNYQAQLLIGGGGHRTGKPGGKWQELREFAKVHYPKAQETCHWAAQDCITLDGIPYIGKYGGKADGIYVATGFNKWGMTSAMVAADLLRDLILEKENPYRELYDPQRTMWHPQLFGNLLESTVNLLTPTTKRCPHLGCALKWNPEEHSWDCSCHGSRFKENGELLNNPATGDLKTKN